jgi:hypothetical protein
MNRKIATSVAFFCFSIHSGQLNGINMLIPSLFSTGGAGFIGAVFIGGVFIGAVFIGAVSSIKRFAITRDAFYRF